MIDFDTNPTEYLLEKLRNKSVMKQKVFFNAKQAFVVMKVAATEVVKELDKQREKSEKIRLGLRDMGDWAFTVEFAGDTIMFLLQTNVITFEKENILLNNKYFQEKDERRFFGQILVYDFMSDTVNLNRVNDQGFLLGRYFVNIDNTFHIEGVRPLHYLFHDGENEVTPANMKLFIQKTIAVAADNDLLGNSYAALQTITLNNLSEKKELGHGQKIGFQMGTDEKAH